MILTPRQVAELAHEVARELRATQAAESGRPEVVDANGLAAALGLSVSTIDRLVANGRITTKFRVGRGVRRFCVAEAIAQLSANSAGEA